MVLQRRINLGNVLSQIEHKYQVKGKDVLAVWGVESNFGKTLGKDYFQSLLPYLVLAIDKVIFVPNMRVPSRL